MNGQELIETAEELQRSNYDVKVKVDDFEKSTIIGRIYRIYKSAIQPNLYNGIEISASNQTKEITNPSLNFRGNTIYLSAINVISITPLSPEEYYN